MYCKILVHINLTWGLHMKVGTIALLVGLVIAIIGAFVSVEFFPMLLVIVGLVVGYFNVSGGESRRFMIAAIAFMMTNEALAGLPMVGEKLTAILGSVGTMVGAAALLVAVMTLFDMSKD